MVELTKALTIETGNWVIAISFAVATIWIGFRARVNQLSGYDCALVKSAGITVTGVAINAAWFALSRHTAGPGHTWHPVMYEYRAAMVAITAAIILYGITKFIWLIEGYSSVFAIGFVILVFIAAFLLGVV